VAAIEAWLVETRGWAENQLKEALAGLDPGPAGFDEALRYSLFAGGKRLRPGLVRLVCAQFGGDDVQAAPAAAAIEMVHTYSLVHDDLPCMDDDDLRRGRPTCHKVYGEAVAVLVGDALLTAAFECLGQMGGERGAEATRVLARAAGAHGMVGGQALDLAGSGQTIDVDGVRQIHQMKTAALISAACELGVIAALGNVDREDPRRLAMRGYGEALGLLFQAVDDVLDVTADAAVLGKTPGKDAEADKPTLVAALGLDGARAACEELAERARGCAREAGCQAGDLPLELVERVLERDR
jgi:geranylgeranyl pyrophosphate synthase